MQKVIAAVEKRLGSDGRVVVRYSGTESKARVMIEGTDEAGIRAQANEIAQTLQRELGRLADAALRQRRPRGDAAPAARHALPGSGRRRDAVRAGRAPTASRCTCARTGATFRTATCGSCARRCGACSTWRWPPPRRCCAIAREVKPDFCTLVPEKREERTTEGGLAVGARRAGREGRRARWPRRASASACSSIRSRAWSRRRRGWAASAPSSCTRATTAWRRPGARRRRKQLQRLELAARAAADAGLRLGAGHGLDYANLAPVVALPGLEELNIGHGLVARAVLIGMRAAVDELRAVIDARRGALAWTFALVADRGGDAGGRRGGGARARRADRCGSWRTPGAGLADDRPARARRRAGAE